MIGRRWRGWADSPENADAYIAHFEDQVRPLLAGTDGFIDAQVERVIDIPAEAAAHEPWFNETLTRQ